MGDPPKQRRRIVPQRVEPSEVAANSGPAHSGEVLQSPQGDHRYASRLNLQEQASIAAAKLGPGRRIYVDISKDPNVDWQKLQKAAAAAAATSGPADKAAAPEDANGMPELPESAFKDPTPRSKNSLNSVIQRLEQQFVMRDDDDSGSDDDKPAPDQAAESSSDEAADGGGSGKEAGRPGGGPGAGSGTDGAGRAVKSKKNGDGGEAGAIKDDQYDYEDNFIDDSEFVEYYAGDRRKAKHTGFFVNTGEIEKTGELVDGVTQSPKKRRKKASGGGLAVGEGGATAGGPPPTKKAKGPNGAALPSKKKAVQPTAGTGPSADVTSVPPTRDAFGGSGPPATPPGGAILPTSSSSLPGAGPYVKSADVVEALTALRRVAMAEPPAEGPVKRMPDSVRTAIQAFVGAYDREVKRHKDAQRYLNTELIGFLEPFTSRSNLSSVLRKCVDKMHRDYADAKNRLRSGVNAAATAALTSHSQSTDGRALSEHFLWTPDVTRALLDFVQLRGQVKGPATLNNGKVFGMLCASFWPHPGMMNKDSIQQAYNDALAAGQAAPAAVPSTSTFKPAPPAKTGKPSLTQEELAAIMLGRSAPTPAATSPAAGGAVAATAAAPICALRQPTVPAVPSPLPSGASAPAAPLQQQPVAASLPAAVAVPGAAPQQQHPPSAAVLPGAVAQPVQAKAVQPPQPAPPTVANAGLPVAQSQPARQTAPAVQVHQVQPPAQPVQQPVIQVQQPGGGRQVVLQQTSHAAPQQDTVWNAARAQQHALPQQAAAPAGAFSLSSYLPQPGGVPVAAAPSVPAASPLGGAAERSNPAGPPEERSRAAAVPADPVPHIQAGVALGANSEVLQANVKAFGTTSIKGISHLALMHAGPTGYKVAQIVNKVIQLGIADWPTTRSKLSSVSGVVNKEPAIVNIGSHVYALAAFPGVAPQQPPQSAPAGSQPAAAPAGGHPAATPPQQAATGAAPAAAAGGATFAGVASGNG